MRIQVTRVGQQWVRVSDGQITGECVLPSTRKLIHLHPEFSCKIGQSIVFFIHDPSTAAKGANEAWLEVEITDGGMFPGVNKMAQEYAAKHAFERWQWPEINEAVRDRLRQIIKDAYNKNGTIEATVVKIMEVCSISESRARLIAQTEISQAQVGANFEAWKSTGLVHKVKWLAVGRDVCPICAANNREVRLVGEKFPSGHLMPLAHPGCYCILDAVLD